MWIAKSATGLLWAYELAVHVSYHDVAMNTLVKP